MKNIAKIVHAGILCCTELGMIVFSPLDAYFSSKTTKLVKPGPGFSSISISSSKKS